MNITFPQGCVTPASRLEWSYCMQEKLRLLQKYMRLWHVEGITQNVYNRFPDKIKSIFPYSEDLLLESNYKTFLSKLNKFEMALWVAMGQEKEKAFNSTYWSPNIDTDIN